MMSTWPSPLSAAGGVAGAVPAEPAEPAEPVTGAGAAFFSSFLHAGAASSTTAAAATFIDTTDIERFMRPCSLLQDQRRETGTSGADITALRAALWWAGRGVVERAVCAIAAGANCDGFGPERMLRPSTAEVTSMQTRLLIGAELVPGEGPAEDILDPATGKVIAQVPEASEAQVAAAAQAAQQAFPGWGGPRSPGIAPRSCSSWPTPSRRGRPSWRGSSRRTPASRTRRRSATSCRRSRTCSGSSPAPRAA